MGEAVSDATVLIFLGKLGRLDDLAGAYDRVLIPPTVHEEVVIRGRELGAADAALVAEAIEAGWIAIREPASIDRVSAYGLEAGETAALSLALERDHDVILADEESVREVARLVGLRPKGTLFFLLTALRDGRTDFDGFLSLLEALLESGFYLDEAVYLEVVRRARRLAD